MRIDQCTNCLNNADTMINSSSYIHLTRKQWCSYRHDEPLTLTESDLEKLRGTHDAVSLAEVEEIYLPMSRLLSLYVTATQSLHSVTNQFLNNKEPKVPYIIGVSGSVAVGKSTTSRVLQALLSRWPDHPNVALVTTDGFLYPTAELEKRDILNRKGFPESYDLPLLLQFLHDLKSGKGELTVPVYSHHTYDIVPNDFICVNHPDIVIIEGLNILQTASLRPQAAPKFYVSDFIDFSIFVDAELVQLKQWYLERVSLFCQGPFLQADSYFHFLTRMTEEEVMKFAERVWHEVNELNLIENILPFCERANLILQKGPEHRVEKVSLRKL